MEGSRGIVLVSGLAALLMSVVSASAAAPPTGLPADTDPRPGPEILYSPLATSPQLENTGVWQAQPILVSGSVAYRAGEYLYQDWLYDDKGAGPSTDATLPPSGVGTGPYGMYTYPTGPAYAGNAADLVEVRARLLPDATAFRLTFNTMLDPSLVATTIALGGTAGTTYAIPHGANAVEPATMFATIHGSSGDLVDAASGTQLATNPTVTVDTSRRQVEVRVPFSAFDPRGQSAVRLAAAAGLWDNTAGAYLIPQQTADATHPGGAPRTGAPTAFFNVAFRMSEPRTDNGWAERQQAATLASGDLSPFAATVDFNKLASGTTDDSAVQTTGYLDRIFVSHFEDGQGKGADGGSTIPCAQPACQHQYAGRLQPYALYVPSKVPPVSGYGLTLDLHGCASNYNFALPTGATPNNRRMQLGERGTGSLVLTVEGRGDCYWYWGEAGAEVFEAWADVAAHYTLDPTYTVITGESMGGYGTNDLAGLFPDLFARAAPYIPCPTANTVQTTNPTPAGTRTSLMLPSWRNLPQFTLAGSLDVVCDYPQEMMDANQIDSLGYRYQFWSYPDIHDLVFMTSFDTLAPVVAWMGDAHVDRNPPHVTYVLNAAMNQPGVGMTADHAYWVSGLHLRDNPSNTATLDTTDTGTIDVFSHGFGTGDPTPGATQHGACIITGGSIPPALPCVAQSKDWGSAPSTPVADTLDISAQNISSVTINATRARVDCNATLNITSDGPLQVNLVDCPVTPVVPEAPAAAILLAVGAVVVCGHVAAQHRRRRRRCAAG